MTPFLELRLWMRRAPAGERALAATILLVLLALASWAVVPVDHASTPLAQGVAAPAAAPNAPSGNVAAAPSASTPTSSGSPQPDAPTNIAAPSGVPTTPITSAPSSGLSPAPNAGPTTALAAPSCPSGSTDEGITPTTINIDVDVPDLAGQAGNSLAGIPPPQEEEAMFAAAIDAANIAGGARCRRIVAKYYRVNALDQPSLQASCLDIVADHPFALLDDGFGSPIGAPAPRDCPPSHKVPEFGVLPLSQAEINQYAPYLFGDDATAEQVVHDWVLGAHQLGWFNGAKKIGLLEQECIPDLNTLALHDLASVGIPSSTVTKFDFGCTNQLPPPSEVQQAVLQFKNAGVTHVMDDAGEYENTFSKQAQVQNYHPQYSVGDQSSTALWDNPTFGPDKVNFSGALVITPMQYGAENTAGSTFNAATAACDKAMTSKGLPAAEHSPDGLGGVACTLVTMLVLAANRAPALRRDQLQAGLATAGTVGLPFPAGPANFTIAHGQHAGGFWRADVWDTSCSCFRVKDPTFRPDFP